MLKPGGRYGIHELCLIPDDLAEGTKQEIQNDLSTVIHHGTRPLTIAEWQGLLKAEGFSVQTQAQAPMHLLEPWRPTEALGGSARRRYFNRRRQADPLGEGQPCTWRSLLIKVAAEVIVSSRRVLVRLSASWPHLDWYRQLCLFLNSGHPVPSG